MRALCPSRASLLPGILAVLLWHAPVGWRCAAQERIALEATSANGASAREALIRSRRVLHAWMSRMDPVTRLLPQRGQDKSWTPHNAAADLYPFLVMAAWFTDRKSFDGEMYEILRHEIRLSTRVGMLSDTVLPGGKGFAHERVDMDRIIFGSCEYAKDGLLPLTELLGDQPWYHRMRGIADDMIVHAPYATRFGRVPSLSAEVNGQFLQVLSRLAYKTGERRYIDQALRIGDLYFQEVIPGSNGLPAHQWDVKQGKPASDEFRLSDHGNEIVGGLSELVLYLKETSHPRFAEFQKRMAGLIDALLECGLNEDGVWYTSVRLSDRSPLDQRHAHCWGYLFNAVYTAYLITGEARFLDATKRALRAVTDKPTYLDDPAGSGRGYGSNAYSDALESAIVLLNRLPDPQMFEALDVCATRFLRRQRDDGIIEDWYGDGNYVRTALMYALMKSQGAWLEPWREDLRMGATVDEKGIVLTLACGQPWQGRIHFDYSRHKAHFNISTNYPRLNEFPEWFVVDPCWLYEVRIQGESTVRLGGELVRGLDVTAKPDEVVAIRVASAGGPPYGMP